MVEDKENKIAWAFHKEKSKYALWDDQGNALTPFIFDSQAKFNNGVAVVWMGSSHVLLRNNGKFTDVGSNPIFQGIDGGYISWGDTCYNYDGEIVKCKGNAAHFSRLFYEENIHDPDFSNFDKIEYRTKTGTRIAMKGKKWGLVNSKFIPISEFLYDTFLWCRKDKYLFAGQRDKNNVIKWGLIDTLGTQVLECKYRYVIPHNDGWILGVDDSGKCTYYHEDFINPDLRYLKFWNGELELEPELRFHKIYLQPSYRLNDPYCSEFIGKTNWKFLKLCSEDKIGLYTTNDSIILPMEYDDFDFTAFHSNSLFFAKKGGKFNIYDKEIKQIQPHIFDQILVSPYLHGRYLAVQNESKWGYLDANGSRLIPMEYEKLYFDEKYHWIHAKKNGYWGIINDKNECILPFEYDKIYGLFLMKNGAQGLMDLSGKVIVPCLHDQVWYDQQLHISILVNGDKAIIYDMQRNKKIPFYYGAANLDFVWYDKGSGYYMTCMNGKWGCLNEEGELVIPFEFRALSGFVNGKAHAVLGKVKPVSPREFTCSRGTPTLFFLPAPVDYVIDLSGRMATMEYRAFSDY